MLASCLEATIFFILTLNLNNSLDLTPKTCEIQILKGILWLSDVSQCNGLWTMGLLKLNYCSGRFYSNNSRYRVSVDKTHSFIINFSKKRKTFV